MRNENAGMRDLIPIHRRGLMPIRIRCFDELPVTTKHTHSKGDAVGNILTLAASHAARKWNSASYADLHNYC